MKGKFTLKREEVKKLKRKIFSVLFALVLVLSFGLVMAVPAEANTPDHYVAASGTNTAPYDTWATAAHKIQDAIGAAGTGDTVHVAAGSYVEDLAIPASKTNLELVGATGAIIKGVQVGTWPTHVPGIDVLASGVKIHGFTIESPDYSAGKHSSGIIVGAANVEIYENSFVIKDDGSGDGWGVSIETYGKWAGDVSGLNIHHNTFTSTTGTDKGSEGIYINYNSNNPTPAGTVTIANNTFGGQIFRAITTERSKTTISGNTISSSFAAGAAFNAAYLGISISSPGANLNPNQDTVVMTGNTVNGFYEGVRLGGTGNNLTNISVTGNMVETNTTGIKVYVSADGVVVNFNNINGNTLYGVENADTANTLDATHNWWGAADGPSLSPGSGDEVSNHVDYDPWLGAPVVVPGGVHHETLDAGTDQEVDASDEADTIVTVTTTGPTEIYIARYASPPFPDEPFPEMALGKYIDIHVSNPDNVTWPIRVEVSYTHAEVNAAGIDEGSLRLYYCEMPGASFCCCCDTGVNVVQNFIWANVTEEEACYLVGTPFGPGGSPPPPPPPPPPYVGAVGGEAYPINKANVLALWLGLALILAIGGGIVVMRRRKAN